MLLSSSRTVPLRASSPAIPDNIRVMETSASVTLQKRSKTPSPKQNGEKEVDFHTPTKGEANFATLPPRYVWNTNGSAAAMTASSAALNSTNSSYRANPRSSAQKEIEVSPAKQAKPAHWQAKIGGGRAGLSRSFSFSTAPKAPGAGLRSTLRLSELVGESNGNGDAGNDEEINSAMVATFQTATVAGAAAPKKRGSVALRPASKAKGAKTSAAGRKVGNRNSRTTKAAQKSTANQASAPPGNLRMKKPASKRDINSISSDGSQVRKVRLLMSPVHFDDKGRFVPQMDGQHAMPLSSEIGSGASRLSVANNARCMNSPTMGLSDSFGSKMFTVSMNNRPCSPFQLVRPFEKDSNKMIKLLTVKEINARINSGRPGSPIVNVNKAVALKHEEDSMKAREDDDMYNNTSGRTITGSGKNFAAHTPSRMRNLSASPIMMSAAAASKGTKSKRVTLKPTATVKVAVAASRPSAPAVKRRVSVKRMKSFVVGGGRNVVEKSNSNLKSVKRQLKKTGPAKKKKPTARPSQSSDASCGYGIDAAMISSPKISELAFEEVHDAGDWVSQVFEDKDAPNYLPSQTPASTDSIMMDHEADKNLFCNEFIDLGNDVVLANEGNDHSSEAMDWMQTDDLVLADDGVTDDWFENI